MTWLWVAVAYLTGPIAVVCVLRALFVAFRAVKRRWRKPKARPVAGITLASRQLIFADVTHLIPRQRAASVHESKEAS